MSLSHPAAVMHPEAEPGEKQLPSSPFPRGAIAEGIAALGGELLLCARGVLDLECSVPWMLLPGTRSVPQGCGSAAQRRALLGHWLFPGSCRDGCCGDGPR